MIGQTGLGVQGELGGIAMSKCLLTTRRDVLLELRSMRGRFLAKPRGARRERAPGGPKDARDICISLHFLFGIERFQSLATHPTGFSPPQS